MSVGSSSFSHSIPILYGSSVGNYIKQFFRLIGRNIILVKYFFFLFPIMLIYTSDFFSSTNVILLEQDLILKRYFLLGLSI